MAIQLGDIFRITATLLLADSNLMQNVFYTQLDSGTIPTNNAVVAAMRTWVDDMYTIMEDHMKTTVSLDEVQVSKWIPGSPGTWDDIGSDAGTFAGLAVGELLPDGVALVMRAVTDAVKVVGRKYLGGLVESAVNNTAWEANVIVDALLFVISWYEGPVPTVREFISGVFSTVLQDFVPFEANGIVSSIPGYQRRRKPGVGM